MRLMLEELRSQSAGELVRLALRVVVEAFTKNLGTKALALIVTLIVFGVTREEIQRSYRVPVHVLQDPDRVLIGVVPEEVDVELRGPWTELSPLDAGELGHVVVDLREAKEGPLQIEVGGLTLPPRVALVETHHEPVDLHFDLVIETWIDLVPTVTGEVDADHEQIRVTVQPEQWRIRGAQSDVDKIGNLELAPIDVSGARETVEKRVEIIRPSESVQFLGLVDASSPRVLVRVEVRALNGDLELAVPVASAIAEALPELDPAEIAPIERVTVRGPRSMLRRIEMLKAPLNPRVTVKAPQRIRRDPTQIEVRFEWSDAVDLESRGALRLEPAVVRLSIAPKGARDGSSEEL